MTRRKVGGTGGGASSVTSPNIYPSNLVLWLDAKDPSNNATPVDGTRYSTWYDKSGSSRNATATIAPTTGTTAVQWKNNANGIPGFYFDSGVTSSANFNNGSNISITNNRITVFIVSSYITGTSQYSRSFVMTSSSGVSDWDNVSSVGFLRYGTTRYNNVSTNGVVFPYDGSTLYDSTFVNYFQYDGTTVYANLLIGSTTAADASANNTGNFNISYLSIGSVGGDKLTGYVHEILVYNTALNNSARRQVEGYLSWKWGLQTNLPSSHPYYSITPLTVKYTPVNMLLWLDAADPYNTGVTPTADTRITTWKDKSGGGRDATATIAPTTGTTAVKWTTVNGKPAFFFDAGSTSSVNFNGTISITGDKITVFAVVNFSSSSPGHSRIISFGESGSSYDWESPHLFMGGINSFATGLNTFTERPAGTIIKTVYNSQYGSTYLHTLKCDGSKAYVNMLFGDSTTTDVSMNLSGNFVITYFTIGSVTFADLVNGKMAGYISEILVYNIALSDADRKRVEGYLSWKWGVQANLPSTHPYYSAAP